MQLNVIYSIYVAAYKQRGLLFTEMHGLKIKQNICDVYVKYNIT